jgi:hypothetical protein
LPDAYDVKAQTHQPVRNILRWGVHGEMPDYCFNRFFRFLEEGVEGQLFLLQECLYGRKVSHFFRDNSRPAPGAEELEIARDKPFELPLQLHQVSGSG